MVSGVSSSASMSASSATAWISQQFQTAGLSSDKADTAATDVLTAAETSLTANPDESDADFRTALDKQIDQDVSSGKLSQDDADTVKKALDQMTGTTDAAGDAAPAASSSAQNVTSADSGSGVAESAGGSGGGGGGGGGSSAKTEVSRTTTVSGSTKTIVIVYSDDSSATETSTATQADHDKYDKHPAATKPDDATRMAKDYLAQTPPGTFIDKTA